MEFDGNGVDEIRKKWEEVGIPVPLASGDLLHGWVWTIPAFAGKDLSRSDWEFLKDALTLAGGSFVVEDGNKEGDTYKAVHSKTESNRINIDKEGQITVEDEIVVLNSILKSRDTALLFTLFRQIAAGYGIPKE